MDHFFNSLPRSLVMIGAILIGFVFIVINDPPRTVCDSQMELFRESQRAFLYPPIGGGEGKPAVIGELYEICKDDNSPGGCFDYFQKLKQLAVDLRNIPRQCSEQVASESEVRTWLLNSLKLMAQIAWGERAPASFANRHGWFDTSDVAIYCDLKESATRVFGHEAFNQWRDGVLATLPQAGDLDQDGLYRKSIFSTPCRSYQ